jgi:hypothetical protein
MLKRIINDEWSVATIAEQKTIAGYKSLLLYNNRMSFERYGPVKIISIRNHPPTLSAS